MKIITTALLAMSLQFGGAAFAADTNLVAEAQYTLDLVGIMELSSAPARTNLIPEVTSSDIARIQKIIAANAKTSNDSPIIFHKGQQWNGATTYFAGVEVANVYSVWQAPGKYTTGEWSTWLAVAVAGYFAGEEFDIWGGSSSSSSSVPDSSTQGDVAGSGGNRFGNINNSTINITTSTTFAPPPE